MRNGQGTWLVYLTPPQMGKGHDRGVRMFVYGRLLPHRLAAACWGNHHSVACRLAKMKPRRRPGCLARITRIRLAEAQLPYWSARWQIRRRR